MVSTRSADVAFPLIGKPIDRLSSLKLPTNLEVMQRFLYHFKCDKLSKQKSINRTCDEVVLLWQKVAEGSTPGYTCYLSVNSIKTRINTLWEEYRTTQAWGKRSSEEQSKASKNFKEKLESLFDIARPDIEFRLCEDDWKLVQDQRMERKSTFGNRDTKLLACLERKKIREENHKRRQDQAKEEQEMLTMVFGGKESDGSVEEQTGEDFCEPLSKQRNNPDRILLHVPRNIASTSQVVMTADRHKISSNALNDIIASIIRESQGCVEDFVLSQISTLRGRKKLRSLKFESVKEHFLAGLDNHYFTIHWDEKLLKCGKAYTHKEHLAVLASSTNGKLVKLLGITDLDSGTGLNQAKAVKNMLEEWIIEQRCVAMCFDSTASNTGKFAGACILLEALIGHPLLWTSCRHHMLEFILGDVLKVIFGPSSSTK